MSQLDVHPVQRATDVVAQLSEAGIRACLLGGLGVAVHRHGQSPPVLERTYGDVDIVVAPGAAAAVSAALGASHAPSRRFNALHGDRRLIFNRLDDGEQLDVFIGRFAMCHALDLADRLGTGTPALSPSDLLLTKAQVVEINDKDLLDLLSLLYHHHVEAAGDVTADVIDLARLGAVCGADWGWYTTVTDNLAKVEARAGELLDPAGAERVTAACGAIHDHLAATSKSLRWRARAKLGRKVAWYELPEEIAHG